VSAHAQRRAGQTQESLERAWWLRVPATILAPTAVFAAIRDDSDEAARARQEPVAAIVGLAGIAAALASPVARHLLNDPAYSPIVIPVWAFIGGAISALAAYWLLGVCLYYAGRRLGSLGSFRRARHVLGFASLPLAVSLVTLWPIRIAVYGTDLFRTGGDDFGRGDAIFGALYLGFVAWSLLLLLIGVRAVHGWTWARSAAALALAAVVPTLLVLASTL
jgi:hypothetical protein